MSEDTTEEMDPVLKAVQGLRADVNARFDQVDQLLNGFEVRLERYEVRTTPLSETLTRIDTNIAAIQKDVRGLKESLIEVNHNLSGVLLDHERRVAALEEARLQPS